MSFALYMPIGPGDSEAAQAADTVDSVIHNGDGLTWVVLVDDAPEPRSSPPLWRVPSGCRVTVIRNPRQDRRHGHTGGLCVADLVALRYVHAVTGVDFVLKLDTDALVVAPFVDDVRRVLTARPDAGLLGVIGDSFAPDRTYRLTRSVASVMERILSLPDTQEALAEPGRERLGPYAGLARDRYDRLIVARGLLRQAVQHGYRLGEYCQGGGYVVSRRMLDAIADAGAFADPLFWEQVNVGEDVMLAMQCGAVGLRLYDAPTEGVRFAIHPGRLPLSCADVVRARYSIVHSIKGPGAAEFREFFRQRRRPD